MPVAAYSHHAGLSVQKTPYSAGSPREAKRGEGRRRRGSIFGASGELMSDMLLTVFIKILRSFFSSCFNTPVLKPFEFSWITSVSC